MAYFLQHVVTEVVPSGSALPPTVWVCGARCRFASAFQKMEKLFDTALNPLGHPWIFLGLHSPEAVLSCLEFLNSG